jgi:hypothetical protein
MSLIAYVPEKDPDYEWQGLEYLWVLLLFFGVIKVWT